METRAETAERAKDKVRKVKFEKFDPQEASKFLPGWEYRETDDGGVFERALGEKRWILIINKSRKLVVFHPTTGAPREGEIRVGDVNEVELNPLNRTLSFLRKKDGYHISLEGLSHYIASSDGKMSVHVGLGKPQ